MNQPHSAPDLPTRFGGRYTLLRQVAVGGMAEIYLARQAARAGFDKLVVIKRLRAELASDPRIVEMFLDEARVGAVLNHPNIVHVYDVGEHAGVPYIAMEYIVGEELNELCRRGLAHKQFLPLEHAVELVRQAAAGMGYFHARRGTEGTPQAGQPLDIVHLDISPSNLLVTQDGFLKIIDFGIANARGQRARSDVIPGKLGYMSPEQAARGTVDHRSDIFSLGIVLYEITVGRRLFRGAPQEVIARLVEAKVEAPTFVRRTFPAGLEAIVMRALEKHPGDRYQSAYDLADDLEAFLRDERLHSGPVRIARYLDVLALAGGGTRRPELVSEAEAAAAGAANEPLDFDSQAFDGYTPWDDADEPEAEVAAALGMELEELRALRTPVPGRSSAPDLVDDPADATTPVPRLGRAAAARGGGDDDDEDEDDADEMTRVDDERDPDEAPTLSNVGPAPALPPAPAAPARATTPASPVRAVSPVLNPTALGGTAPRAPSAPELEVALPVAHARPYAAPAAAAGPPSIAQRLPWILVGALGVAVAALVAYIVMSA